MIHIDTLGAYSILTVLFGIAAFAFSVAAGLATIAHVEKNCWRATWGFTVAMIIMVIGVAREADRQESDRRDRCEQAGGVYLHRDNVCADGVIIP